MTATTHSTALVTVKPAFTDAERLALAGFLAGYRGLTREAYTPDRLTSAGPGWTASRTPPRQNPPPKSGHPGRPPRARPLDRPGRRAPPSAPR
jgi:hypothetical protein